MKHILFLLCAFLAYTTSVNAQKDGDCVIPTDTIVYLYNTECNAFLLGANKYNTQASVSPRHGVRVRLEKNGGYTYGRAYGSVIYETIDSVEWDGESYFVLDFVETGDYAQEWRNVFIEKDTCIFVDQAGGTMGADNLWTIRPSKRNDGSFTISVSAKNRFFKNTNLYLGVESGDTTEVPVVSILPAADNHIYWKALSEREYVKVITEEDRKAQQRRREQVRAELACLIDSVKTHTMSMEVLSVADSVCRSASASINDLFVQIGELRRLVAGGDENGCVDFTSLIKNANFDAWFGEGWNVVRGGDDNYHTMNTGGAGNPGAEAWQSTFSLSQVIEGLPVGLYRLDVQAFHRTHTGLSAWAARDSTVIPTEIFLNEMSVPVKSLFADALDAASKDNIYIAAMNDTLMLPIQSGIAALYPDGTCAPHGMDGASIAFNHGLYENSVYCYVTGGAVNLGIRQDKTRSGSWSLWDNFRLIYIGDGIDKQREVLRSLIAIAEHTQKQAFRKILDVSDFSRALLTAKSILSTSNKSDELMECMESLNNEYKYLRSKLLEFAYQDSGTDLVNTGSVNCGETVVTESSTKQDIYDIAHQFIYEDKLEEAEQNLNVLLEKCMQEETLDSVFIGRAHYGLGDCLYRKYLNNFEDTIATPIGKIEECLVYYENSLKWLPAEYKFEIYHAKMSIVYAYRFLEDKFGRQGYLDKAIALAEEIRDTADDNVILKNILMRLYYIYYNLEKYDKALETVLKSIELDSESLYHHDDKGELLLLLGREAEALDVWKYIIEKNPLYLYDYPQSYLYRALKRRGLIE